MIFCTVLQGKGRYAVEDSLRGDSDIVHCLAREEPICSVRSV